MEGWLSMAADRQPLRLYRGSVKSDWIDYNGHMTEGFYGVVFGDASDEMLIHIGFGEGYRREVGGSFYTVETHIRFLRELSDGDPLVVDTQVLGADPKRVHLFHTLRHGREEYEAATQETLMLHVDTSGPAVTAMAPDLYARLAEVARAHSSLPIPEGASRSIKSVPSE